MRRPPLDGTLPGRARGIIGAGARRPRPGWCKGPVGTEGEAPAGLGTTESNTPAFKRC
jgi:hypothetical protein